MGDNHANSTRLLSCIVLSKYRSMFFSNYCELRHNCFSLSYETTSYSYTLSQSYVGST